MIPDVKESGSSYFWSILGKRRIISKLNDQHYFVHHSGGELFDRITPDKGMEEWRAQRFLLNVNVTIAVLNNPIFSQVVQPVDCWPGVFAQEGSQPQRYQA